MNFLYQAIELLDLTFKLLLSVWIDFRKNVVMCSAKVFLFTIHGNGVFNHNTVNFLYQAIELLNLTFKLLLSVWIYFRKNGVIRLAKETLGRDSQFDQVLSKQPLTAAMGFHAV